MEGPGCENVSAADQGASQDKDASEFPPGLGPHSGWIPLLTFCHWTLRCVFPSTGPNNLEATSLQAMARRLDEDSSCLIPASDGWLLVCLSPSFSLSGCLPGWAMEYGAAVLQASSLDQSSSLDLWA